MHDYTAIESALRQIAHGLDGIARELRAQSTDEAAEHDAQRILADADIDVVTPHEPFALSPTDEEYDALKLEAANMGQNAGRSAGTWYFGTGASREQARAVAQGIIDGDPEILDTFPTAPLSGEWADDPTPTSVLAAIYDSCGIEQTNSGEHDDVILGEWEAAYVQAAEQQIEREALAMLADDDTDPDTDVDPEHVAEISAVFDLAVTVTQDASGAIRSVWAPGHPDHVQGFDIGDPDFVEQLVQHVILNYTCRALAEITTDTDDTTGRDDD